VHRAILHNIALWFGATGSTKANGREPKSCLGRVFNFKLGCFVMCTIAWPIQARLSLELKTRPRFHPVSLILSMGAMSDNVFHNLSHYLMQKSDEMFDAF
jgi:hypothetical protein